jgi:hypothetical protein
MAARQVRTGKEFARHVVPAVIKPARTLWNQFIAFLFCVFGVIFGFKTFHLWRDYAAAAPGETGDATLRLAIAGFCTLLMFWFGIGSYLKARRIARS